MLKLLSSLFILAVLFTGCYSKQSETVIVPEKETKVLLPDYSHYEYISAPSLDKDISKMNKDKVIETLLEYSIKQQTTIMLYENRTDSLKSWRDEMVKIYKVEDR